MKFTFELYGKPQGKARPRYSSKSRAMYTPQKTREYEKRIQTAYRISGGSFLMFGDKPLTLSVTAYFKKTKNPDKVPTKKPDGDNILKVVADSLNGLVYEDDKQIVDWSIKKRFGKEKIVVVIEDFLE